MLPENDGDGYFLLVEGGKKVRLAAGSAAYRNEQIGVRDINIFSINDLNIIENNPIYSYGIYFQPYEIFEDCLNMQSTTVRDRQEYINEKGNKSVKYVVNAQETMIARAKQQQIQEALRKLDGVTKVIIAHRISAVKNADEIIILKDGIIAERGKHQQLLEKHGLYYETYQSQYGDVEGGEVNGL